MSTIGLIAQPDRGTLRQHPGKATAAQKPESGWLDGVLATPFLVLAVCGYQVAVLILKVVNRERAIPPPNGTRHSGASACRPPTAVTTPASP